MQQWAKNCDVDFPGISNLSINSECGGSIDNLNLGKDIYMGDGDVFTFDSPGTISISGSLGIFAQGDGTIVIPVGVTVNVSGNMQLDPQKWWL